MAMLEFIVLLRRTTGPIILIFIAASCGSAVQAACTVSTSGVAFGTYNPSLGTNVDSTGTITVQADLFGCSNYTLALSQGGTSYSPRLFTTGPTPSFAYNLYTDLAHSSIWGDGTAGTQTVTGGALGFGSRSRTHTIYGRIPASQYITPGTYSAQIIISSGGVTSSVSANISAATLATCTITATPLVFGTYIEQQLDAISTISVNCTNTTNYSIDLNNGNYGRQMNGPAASRISYNMFTNAQRLQVWGTGAGGVAVTGTGTGSGSVQPLTVYGRIGANQFKNPGDYNDVVTVTITY